MTERAAFATAGNVLAAAISLALGGGGPKLLAKFETDRVFGFDWSRDGKYLACARGLWAANVVLIRDFK